MSVEEVIAASKARIESLLVPVNGGVGDDVSYDEKFEALKTETDKLQSLTGEQVNWGNMASLAAELLETKSKDFRVVCYAAAARLQEGSLESVLDAIVLMTEFDKAFWEACHPPLKRLRARAGMLGFMGEQAGKVKDIKLLPKDLDMVQAIDQLSSALDADLRDKFGEAFPGLGNLREGARYLVRSCPKEKPPEAKPEPRPTSAASADAAGGAAPAAPPARVVVQATQPVNPSLLTDVGQVEHVVPNAGRLLVKASALLRAAKPENALAYRLARLGMWIDLERAPAGDRRQHPGAAAARWPQVAPRLAARVQRPARPDQRGRGCGRGVHPVARPTPLRGSRHGPDGCAVHQGQGGAGGRDRHDAAARADLAHARFQQRRAVRRRADQDVARRRGGWGARRRGRGGGRAPAEPSVLDEPIKEAKGLATQGKLPEAIAVVSKAAASAPTPADRFRGRLALAQLCLQSGQFRVATGQLLGLCTEIDRHELGSWQPGLCAEVYAALFAAYKGANTGPDVPAEQLAQQQKAFEQLCRLDPAMALKLGEAK